MTYKTVPVNVGGITIGGGYPVVVQSMTNTDTADRKATVTQIIELADSGSEIVRITVNTPEAAKQVAGIKQDLLDKGYNTPIVGCFHYNGHTLLTEFEDMAKALDKYRINPGNVGFGGKRDKQFEIMVQAAIKHNKPIRIGVNWGSLDQAVLAKLMDENTQENLGKTSDEVLEEALIISALSSAELAEKIGLPQDKIIISCKVSKVRALVRVYRELAKRCVYPLHLGLTEAGMGMRSIAATSAALGTLLMEGIGDTIRASLTPDVGGDRANEVKLCKDVLQSLELRSFAPQVTACPGCGRTTSSFFQELADKITKFLDKQMNIWKETHPKAAELKVAVMGCIVNGPGESKHADIGISLPGTGESPSAPVFIDGVKVHTLRGANIAEEFIQIVTEYVEKKYAEVEV